AGHAVTAAAPASELGAAHGDDVDAGFPQQRVRVRIPVVGDDDAGRQRDDVVAVVPLFALRLPGVAAGFDDAESTKAQRVLDDVEEMAFVFDDLGVALAV